MNINAIAICIGFVVTLQELYGEDSLLPSLEVARRFHTATVLPSGKLLIVGGLNNEKKNLRSVEIFDPATNKLIGGPSLKIARSSHTVTVLENHTILVAGGASSRDPDRGVTEIYSEKTRVWTVTGSLSHPRSGHTATLLRDGRVLVAGGISAKEDIRAAEIYDPSTGAWSDAGELKYERSEHSATLLTNGMVLFAGGRDSSYEPTPNSMRSCELFNPADMHWSMTDDLIEPRDTHSAVLLRDGGVLVFGDNGEELVTSEVFANGKWTSAAKLPRVPGAYHCSLPLPSGLIMLLGGGGQELETDVSVYDPVKKTWRTAGRMAVAREEFTATLLPNGRVLAVGGRGADRMEILKSMEWIAAPAQN